MYGSKIRISGGNYRFIDYARYLCSVFVEIHAVTRIATYGFFSRRTSTIFAYDTT